MKTGAGHPRPHAVVATNSSISDRLPFTPRRPRTAPTSLHLKSSGRPARRSYWDTEDPYHYVRLQPGPSKIDYVLVGGEDQKSGEADDADDRFRNLEDWARCLIPAWKRDPSVVRPGTRHRHYAGFIGRDPGGSNIYVAMGDSGQGLTHGVMGAMLNASLTLGKDHPWKELYAPGRVPLKAAKNFLTENVTALKSFAEYVAPGELSSLDDLKPGQGGIVRRGLAKIAAYRDEAGALAPERSKLHPCWLPPALEQF